MIMAIGNNRTPDKMPAVLCIKSTTARGNSSHLFMDKKIHFFFGPLLIIPSDHWIIMHPQGSNVKDLVKTLDKRPGILFSFVLFVCTLPEKAI